MPSASTIVSSTPSRSSSLVWPPDYKEFFQTRVRRLARYQDPEILELAMQNYAQSAANFINDWVDTYDPRNANMGQRTRLPLILFPKQRELIDFFDACVQAQAAGLVEKSRDMGATWCACAYSVWMWAFVPGSSVGWGSRKAQYVDRMGDLDSIFEKMRRLIVGLPGYFKPVSFDMAHMKIINHVNGSTITGESGDEIGRGGRKSLYFVDEAAHLEHPEAAEASLNDNTNVPIYMSSVSGVGNVFHRKREAGIDWTPGMEMKKFKTYVMVMDWRDHPAKTRDWYEAKRQQREEEGLLHVFKQEVDRDYAASVANAIMQKKWIDAAIDAHKRIKGLLTGGYVAGLDVADGGGDRNALVRRKGVVLELAEEWGERDTGVTARRAVEAARHTLPISVMYDCVGVGSGVKAEINRLDDDGLLPREVSFKPWDAGSSPECPDDNVIPDDPESPINKDFYMNLKAQGWWELRRRFERTYRVIAEGAKYPADQLISISSEIPCLRKIEKELLQPTSALSTTMRLLVEKTPDGARSPNLADAIMMCYWPVDAYAYDPLMGD
jgi:phage terminase large subunit